MMLNFKCRHCGEQTGEIPFPKTDMEQFWLWSFLDVHNESCGPMTVMGVLRRNPKVSASRQEEQTPAPLRHEHDWLATTPTDDPTIFVQDCSCGSRQRVRKGLDGRQEVLGDAVTEGGSVGNAIFVVHQGKPTVDRWAH